MSRAQCVGVGWPCRADGHERLGLPSALSAHPAAALYGDGLATIDEHGVDRFAPMGVSDPPLSGRRSCSLSVTGDEARAAHSPAVRRGCTDPADPGSDAHERPFCSPAPIVA